MLRAILNKSWRQHPTRHKLYGHLSPITKTIQVRRTRHAGHCWRSRDELISDVLLRTPHMAGQKQDDQLEHTSSSYVRIRDVALKTCQRRWAIGRSGERGSRISVLTARHDDDDDVLDVILKLYPLKRGKTPQMECLTLDIKLRPVIRLRFWSTPSLPLLPKTSWPRLEIHVLLLSLCQIDLWK